MIDIHAHANNRRKIKASYTCKCAIGPQPVMVPCRESSEGIERFMKRSTAIVSKMHRHRSPLCDGKTFDLRISMDDAGIEPEEINGLKNITVRKSDAK